VVPPGVPCRKYSARPNLSSAGLGSFDYDAAFAASSLRMTGCKGFTVPVQPISQPTPFPTPQPTPLPTPQPIPLPTPQPTPLPIPQPTQHPIPQPIPEPIPHRIPQPMPQPTSQRTPLRCHPERSEAQPSAVEGPHARWRCHRPLGNFLALLNAKPFFRSPSLLQRK
jgi:hypothetical protein